eukprot:230511-Pelagomonas_calceolata.AAC.2
MKKTSSKDKLLKDDVVAVFAMCPCVHPLLAPRFIYCSSAGVYLKSDQMPHREEDATDLKSRHKVGFGNRKGKERVSCTCLRGQLS